MDPFRRSLLALPVALAWPEAGRADDAIAPTTLPVVAIQPIGSSLAPAELEAVTEAIQTFYAVEMRVLASVALPASAFYPPRQRYRAERLLDFLVKRAPSDARVTLGLTAADISTIKEPYEDWGVLGLATVDGRSAVLSSFRCKRAATGPAHVRTRFAKTAVHELGHAFGLEHCPTAGCIMHDGEGSVLTTDGEDDLCAESRRRLGSFLKAGAVSPFVGASAGVRSGRLGGGT